MFRAVLVCILAVLLGLYAHTIPRNTVTIV